MRMLLVVSLLLLPSIATAQADALAPLRTKEALSDEDRAALRTWLRERIAALAGDDTAGAASAIDQVRQANSGSAGFREAFAAAGAEAVGAAYRKAGPAGAARLITMLNMLNAADAAPVLTQALGDERVGVRAAAAAGLRAARDRLAAAPDARDRVLVALRDAAKKETSREVLAGMYRAMNYVDVAAGADPRATGAAVLDVLTARANTAAAGPLPADGADHVGVEVAARAASGLGEAERTQYIKTLARLMQYALQAYTSGERPLSKVADEAGVRFELRDATERLIDTAEQQLVTLLNPPKPPQVADSMRKAKAIEMKVQWKAWNALLKPITNEDYALKEE